MRTMTQSAGRRSVILLGAVLAGVLIAASLAAPSAHALGVTVKRNDYNRDGISDIVGVNDGDGCLYRWNGNGSGSFGTGVQLGCDWGAYADSLASVGDINRDGNGDLVSINTSSECLYIWLGAGNGRFGTGRLFGCNWGDYHHNITGPGDLNGDGERLG